MLYRSKPPNQHRWNGLGGKIQLNETPWACVQREVMEEAGIDLQVAQCLRFAGIVTWAAGIDPTSPGIGMYAFIAELPPGWATWEGDYTTPEGLLCWKPISWACDPQNTTVVDNIPHFLPGMLTRQVPHEYYCDYQDGRLANVIIRPCEMMAWI